MDWGKFAVALLVLLIVIAVLEHRRLGRAEGRGRARARFTGPALQGELAPYYTGEGSMYPCDPSEGVWKDFPGAKPGQVRYCLPATSDTAWQSVWGPAECPAGEVAKGGVCQPNASACKASEFRDPLGADADVYAHFADENCVHCRAPYGPPGACDRLWTDGDVDPALGLSVLPGMTVGNGTDAVSYYSTAAAGADHVVLGTDAFIQRTPDGNCLLAAASEYADSTHSDVPAANLELVAEMFYNRNNQVTHMSDYAIAGTRDGDARYPRYATAPVGAAASAKCTGTLVNTAGTAVAVDQNVDSVLLVAHQGWRTPAHGV